MFIINTFETNEDKTLWGVEKCKNWCQKRLAWSVNGIQDKNWV